MKGKQVCWYQFSRKGRCKKLQYLQRSKAVRARHKNHLESAEEKNSRISNIDSRQFGFMPGRGITNALFVVQRMQDKYRARKKR